MRTRKHKPHIAPILTLSLVWLILSANAAASDWFVRPAGGNYGSEDGSSYQDAWDGLQNVVWGPGGVEAGDTLYICGLHLRKHTGGSGWEFFTPAANGTNGNRIEIRGDYPGDQGIVWGAGIMAHEAWNDEEEYDNVWSITLAESVSPDFFFEDITTDSWTILDKTESLEECQATPGSFYSPDYVMSSKFYVHCSDSLDPTDRIAANHFGYSVKLNDNHYINWKNLKLYCNYRLISWIDNHYVTYMKWENITNWYSRFTFFFGNYNHHIELVDCDIAWTLGGISLTESPSGSGTGPYDVVIRRCKVHDIAVGAVGPDDDAHAIVIGGGVHDVLVENNEVYNAGSGITNYSFPASSGMQDVIMRWNYIHDMHTEGGAVGRGIELNMSGKNTSVKSGVECYGNIVANVEDDGYRSTWATDQIVFYNNIAYNCNQSFYFNYTYTNDRGPNIVLRNNISINPTTYHIYFGSASSEGNYTIDSDYNLFYPDMPDGFEFKEKGRSTGKINLSDWQALSRSGCTFGPNSITADPLFVDPENGDFHLWSDSPAINAGVDVGLIQDFEGNPAPQGPAFDIGAYECVVDPDNPTPVLQAIGNKSVDENSALTFDINATDPDSEPITYAVQSLPSGATFSGQTFSWTPSYDQAGSYQVRFIASDGNSNDSETITITVNNVNRAPVLGTIGNQSVDENDLLSFSVSATDADGQTLTYSVSGLPAGAVFASQTFIWTPSYDQAGEYSVTFTADDGQAQDSQTITITVVNVNRAPVLTAIGNRTAYADVLLTFTIDATDPDGDAITYSAGTLPSGATFIGQDFNWTPSQSQVGSYAVTFIATDDHLQDSEAVTMTVDVDILAPTVTNCSPAADSIQVPLNNLITLNIADVGIGVDAATVTIEVNNNIVYTSGASPDGNCQRLGTKADYTFVYQSNEMYDYDQTVIITVNATDLAGNAMDEYSYSFATEMHSFGQNKQVNSGLENSDRPVTVCDSSGNIWSAWHAGSVGNRDIYVSILAAGEQNFGGTVQLTSDATDQCNPAVALDSNDKIYVVWQDNREGDWDIYISTSVDGISWSTETRVNDPNKGNQVNPAIVIDNQNDAHVVWQEDDLAGNKDIFIATSSNGFATPIQITSDYSFEPVEPAVAADSDNTIYVVWTDWRNGSNNIYGWTSNDPNPLDDVEIVSNANNQSSPAIATESAGSILHLLWVDDASGNNNIYYASSDGLPGSPLTGSSIINDSSGADQLDPSIVVTGSTDNNLKVFACWQDWRDADTDLYFAELSAGSGTNVFVDDGGSNADQGEPAVGIGEYDHPYIVWADSRSTDTDIYYAGSTFIEPVALASKLVTASASGSTTVGTDPQAITTVDDVSIVVPAGAFLYDATITLTKISNPQAFAAPCLGGYDFGPSGIQFSQPVTIIIPYAFSSSDSSVTPYWFNSLTRALSQQGITNIQDIPISSSLHALSFKTTHFTAFFLLAGGGAAAIVGGGGGGGCSVSASGEGNIVEYILPYIGLAVVMTILKMRDTRNRKARNMTTGKY